MPSASMNSSAERPSQSSIPLQSSKRCLQSRTSINLPQIFVRYVIEPAKRELDAAAPYSFDFEPIKDGAKNHRISNLRLCIILSEKTRMPKCETCIGSFRSLGISETAMFETISENSIGFTEVEIKNNIEAYQGRT